MSEVKDGVKKINPVKHRKLHMWVDQRCSNCGGKIPRGRQYTCCIDCKLGIERELQRRPLDVQRLAMGFRRLFG